MEELKIHTISNYLDAIRLLKKNYPVDTTSAHSLLYRGLSSTEYKLLPGLLRDRHFAEYDTLLKIERNLLLKFKQESCSIIPNHFTELSHWAEYAQHFGAPTRYLDWSSNPLVALYFSCNNDRKDGIVWLIHTGNYSSSAFPASYRSNKKSLQDVVEEILSGSQEYNIPILYSPNYFSARMSAQSSFFMVWGNRLDPFESIFEDETCYMRTSQINLSEYFSQQSFLFKFIVPKEQKQQLLCELDSVGINEKTLFPGLDGVGRYVNRIFNNRYPK